MELGQSDRENLLKKRASIGLGPKAKSQIKEITPLPEDPLRKVIAEEIRKVLADL